MTTTIDTKAAKSFMSDMDLRISTASALGMRSLVKELQEIRNEAAVMLGMDVPTRIEELKNQMNNGKV